MVPLPLIIPVFQRIIDKGPSNTPEEERELGRTWNDPTIRDREVDSQDEDGQYGAARRHNGGVIIDIDLEPTVEERTNDVEFQYPRVSPNNGRNGTRFKSFSSISAWSSCSSPSTRSLNATTRFRNALKKLWASILQNDDQDSEDEFIPNYRWLPILSGIAIPFSILLQIPGLTERWYIQTSNNHIIDSRPKPSILMAANILAIVAALVANICLMLRFLEKRVKQMTIVALCFLSIHDIINSVTVTVFGVQHRFNDGFTYGQPFWLVVASTGVSLFTTVTLLWDLKTTPEFSKSGSGLTRKQRSLLIIVMILLCWIAFGGLIYSILLQLNFIDGLYFTVVSIETIGFGDFHPTTTGSRIFSIVYNSIGILIFALTISTARNTIIESFEHSYRRRAREVAFRRSEYKRHKANERVKRLAIERMLKDAGFPCYVPDPQKPSKMKLNKEALTPAQLAAAHQEAASLSKRRPQGVTDPTTGKSFPRTLSLDMGQEYPGTTYEENYRNFRRAILKEEKREFTAKLMVAWTFFLTFWLSGAGIFSRTEGWAYGSSLYFCFIAFSTIGYGDISPMTLTGRSVFVVWALLGVGAMTILISVLSEAYSSRYKNVLSKGSLERAVRNSRGRYATSPSSPSAPGTHTRLHSRSVSPDFSPGRRFTREHAKRNLETLPADLLSHAKTFHEHIYYFLNSTDMKEAPPPSLQKLLDEIADGERMDARLKQEILGDDSSRKTLFLMSYEGALRRMIDTAEKAVGLLARQDLIGNNNSMDGLTTLNGQDSETNGFRSFINASHDSRFRFDFDEQRYQRRDSHIHPQGLASEPNLHKPNSLS